jgi:hypothetical protein
MNPKMSGVGILLFLGGLVLGSGGCAVVGVGAVGGAAATTVYLNGELYHAYSVPMEKAWKATEDEVAEMGMKVTEKYIDNMDRNRFIKGKMRDGRECEISLEAKAPDVTVVKVRVGIFGEEAYSQQIHDRIKKRF